jgi:hypothetical protein
VPFYRFLSHIWIVDSGLHLCSDLVVAGICGVLMTPKGVDGGGSSSSRS